MADVRSPGEPCTVTAGAMVKTPSTKPSSPFISTLQNFCQISLQGAETTTHISCILLAGFAQ